MQHFFIRGDAVRTPFKTGAFDLVFGSPPYLDARTYGISAQMDCLEWVEWMLRVTTEAVRVSKGLVLWVAAGVQRDNCYWPGCEGLMWEWWKRGNQLWRPCIWWKVDENEGGTGIPGSGGRQWLRNDWEYVMAFKREGWLPWADNCAVGHEPVYSRIGGKMSNRTTDGKRINSDGTRAKNVEGPMPKVANPGNCIIVKARVGGGHMGDDAAHLGEAPFPEKLAEFFVRSFCPPGGWVCDPFTGTGTSIKAALANGRNAVGLDIRESQLAIGEARVNGLSAADITNGQRSFLTEMK